MYLVHDPMIILIIISTCHFPCSQVCFSLMHIRFSIRFPLPNDHNMHLNRNDERTPPNKITQNTIMCVSRQSCVKCWHTYDMPGWWKVERLNFREIHHSGGGRTATRHKTNNIALTDASQAKSSTHESSRNAPRERKHARINNTTSERTEWMDEDGHEKAETCKWVRGSVVHTSRLRPFKLWPYVLQIRYKWRSNAFIMYVCSRFWNLSKAKKWKSNVEGALSCARLNLTPSQTRGKSGFLKSERNGDDDLDFVVIPVIIYFTYTRRENVCRYVLRGMKWRLCTPKTETFLISANSMRYFFDGCFCCCPMLRTNIFDLRWLVFVRESHA